MCNYKDIFSTANGKGYKFINEIMILDNMKICFGIL